MSRMIAFFCLAALLAAPNALHGKLLALTISSPDDGKMEIKYSYDLDFFSIEDIRKLPGGLDRAEFIESSDIPPEARRLWGGLGGGTRVFEVPRPPEKPGWYWAVMGRDGTLEAPFRQGSIQPLPGGLGIAAAWGGGSSAASIVDNTGRVIYSEEFLTATSLNGEEIIITDRKHRQGMIDRNGATVIPFRYDTVGYFREDRAVVGNGGKFGYVDRAGAEVIAPQYEWAAAFHEGLALVKLNGKFGYIDRNGQIAVPIVYDGAGSFCEGFAIVEEAGRFQIIRRDDLSAVAVKGQVVQNKHGDTRYIPGLENFEFYYFSDGLALVKSSEHRGDNNHGFIDTSGKFVIAPQYFGARPFRQGLSRVVVLPDVLGGETQMYYIDREGKRLFDFSDGSGDLSDGRILVARNLGADGAYLNKFGYMTAAGELVIPFIFDAAGEFHNGYTMVKLPEGQMMIDTNGLPLTPCLPSIILNDDADPDHLFISVRIGEQED